ncbi:MAG: lysophospholipid acyltransferase family protein [Parvibaculum sp.]|nr:lysophospholipid acyltransferase family protein [Parvibaculum sp.]
MFQRLRSFVFNFALYVTAIIIGLIATPALAMPRGAAVFVITNLSRLVLWLLKVTTGTRYELRGEVPAGAVLVAAKHQSMWDTIAFVALVKDPAIVLKAELLWIPYYGWFSWKVRMIAIDRGSGASAIRRLMAQGKAALAANRPIVIFPEGTRSAPGAAPDYKPGVAALYRQMGVPCIPAAVNSGLYWPRRRFLRKAGTIVLEFLPAIPAGLDRATFMATLEASIEEATTRLIAEGKRELGEV